jgi:hypothetical protein
MEYKSRGLTHRPVPGFFMSFCRAARNLSRLRLASYSVVTLPLAAFIPLPLSKSMMPSPWIS